MRAAAAMTLARIGRWSFGIGALFATTLVLLAGLLERREDVVHAADRTLLGAVFGLALPVLGYFVLGRASAGKRLDGALEPVARHGASRKRALLGTVLASAALLGALGMLLAALGVVCARGISDPRLFGDVALSSAIGLGGGVCYACWFALGAQLGAGGGGRIWMLGLDFVLGSGTTALAVPWPRAHLRNLLGAEPVLGMPQWSACIALSVLAFSCIAISLIRTPR